ncbi:TetR/AcrR family transcriptional regulator [Nocardia bovistercoris]|uniref:TetR family transcriptional regulator n=1 Tax=Nocardia bovistercoris TaxID=2785916 RepID=A0A931IG41_9NOCA|nr:TetR family transcriptional regulator [Nocardia bovistercoris]MBH0781092.1 TetR family transcriptional regulator [Nocardia bovistercoris]
MPAVGRSARAEQANSTREAIITAAERLFAERGIAAVSNRQVSEAAGQGNNTAVGYHFGAKADLVRAIVRRHHAHTEQLCRELAAAAEGSTDLRDWVSCLVRPVTEHLACLGEPTWYARFSAQLMPDPGFRDLLADESLASKALQRIIDGLHRCLPELTPELRRERNAMARLLIVHTCAEHERALADGSALRPGWESTANGLVDAITGLYTAPVVGRG